MSLLPVSRDSTMYSLQGCRALSNKSQMEGMTCSAARFTLWHS